jgi:hypothetical protein
MGMPPTIPTKKPRSKRRVEIRWDLKDHHTVVQRAKACGLNTSEFIRRAAMRRQIRSLTDAAAIAELRRLGGLLRHLYPKNANWTPEEKKRYWAGYEKLLGAAKRIEERL